MLIASLQAGKSFNSAPRAPGVCGEARRRGAATAKTSQCSDAGACFMRLQKEKILFLITNLLSFVLPPFCFAKGEAPE